MYCVKCGVELADSEKKCPLCGTEVYYPGIKEKKDETPYPPFEKQPASVNPAGVMFVITIFFVIAEVICLLCDFNVNFSVTWSGYVMGAIALFYLIALFPHWFKRYYPAIFIPCDFAAVLLYLLYICLVNGGKWFLPFALPVTLGACLIVSAVTILCHYLKRGYLFIFSGAFLLSAVYAVVIEILINTVFALRTRLVWSIYPAVTFIILGFMLLIIALVKPLRDSIQKKFFI